MGVLLKKTTISLSWLSERRLGPQTTVMWAPFQHFGGGGALALTSPYVYTRFQTSLYTYTMLVSITE